METLFIPTENDLKKWVKEAVQEFFQDATTVDDKVGNKDQVLLNRKEIAILLRVSLVTLTDWMKRGLPCHKQRGRVYFDKSEVINYIKENKMGQLKFGTRFRSLRQETA